MTAPTNWLDLLPSEAERSVRQWVAARDEPEYRSRQIFRYLWQHPLPSWSAATDLPKKMVADLTAEAPIPRLELETQQVARDGTIKNLWRLHDGKAVESVWIPGRDRATLCISSQAGCAYACAFCATGRMGFERNLTAWEIAGQVREAALDSTMGLPTNVVFMGMGEPLHNWKEVSRSLTILNDARGVGIGARRITVSTIGIIPRLKELARRPEQFRLAISLHAAISERRVALMPVEKKYPIAQLTTALSEFRKRITFEYVMIHGANDTRADADALIELAKNLRAMVNLLPLHPTAGNDLRPTPKDDIRAFASYLKEKGVNVTVRRSRGLDIDAACGQLRVQSKQRRRVQMK